MLSENAECSVGRQTNNKIEFLDLKTQKNF